MSGTPQIDLFEKNDRPQLKSIEVSNVKNVHLITKVRASALKQTYFFLRLPDFGYSSADLRHINCQTLENFSSSF